MARKGERTWFTRETGDLTLASNKGTFVTVNNVEGTLPAGRLKLQRLLGCTNVYLENVTAGAVSGLFVWHGLYYADDELPVGQNIIQRVGDADDNIRWLWREPISLFPHGKPVSAGDDWIVSAKFDWQLRGGRGTKLDVGGNMLYVVDFGATVAATLFKAASTQLELYWGS